MANKGGQSVEEREVVIGFKTERVHFSIDVPAGFVRYLQVSLMSGPEHCVGSFVVQNPNDTISPSWDCGARVRIVGASQDKEETKRKASEEMEVPASAPKRKCPDPFKQLPTREHAPEVYEIPESELDEGDPPTPPLLVPRRYQRR